MRSDQQRLPSFALQLETRIHVLAQELTQRNFCCATAESCTGGMAGAALTAVSGASAWFVGGIISYANSIKEHVLGVPATILETYGAVSQECVSHMALGACRVTGADIAVAISGIAGPGGGTPYKPVGLVYFGFAMQHMSITQHYWIPGQRAYIRTAAVGIAVNGLIDMLRSSAPRT